MKKVDDLFRYVKEWLGAMACGDLIEVTEDEKFYIKPENVQVKKISYFMKMFLVISVSQ